MNSPGSYSCYCDGKKGFKLSKDMKSCEVKLCYVKFYVEDHQVGSFLMRGYLRLRKIGSYLRTD